MPVSARSCSLLRHADEVFGAELGPKEARADCGRMSRRRPCASGSGIDLRALQDRAVPGVHAVELADRDDRRAEAGGDLGRVAEHDHDVTAAAAASVISRSSSGGCFTSHHSPKNGSTSGMNTYP